MASRRFKARQRSLETRKAELRGRATKAESHARALLARAGVEFVFQKGFIRDDLYCIVDFYFPRFKVCLEVDGGYHTTEGQRRRDARRDRYLTRVRGMRIRRLTNEQVLRAKTPEALMRLISLDRPPQIYRKREPAPERPASAVRDKMLAWMGRAF